MDSFHTQQLVNKSSLGKLRFVFIDFIGATNVGTVKVYFDKTLQTNTSKKTRSFKEVCLGNAIDLKRGEPVGEFRMGSTIVLIFEAPVNFNFNIRPGDRIRMGQSLGCVQTTKKFIDKTRS